MNDDLFYLSTAVLEKGFKWPRNPTYPNECIMQGEI